MVLVGTKTLLKSYLNCTIGFSENFSFLCGKLNVAQRQLIIDNRYSGIDDGKIITARW